MDKVKEFLAIACLAYDQGDSDFAIRSFLQGMDEARADGEQGLQQVVEFLRAPVAQIVTNVPAAENTMAPALHSDTADAPTSPEAGVTNSLVAEKPVDPQPVVTAIPEPVPSTITSLSSMIDDGDEELEARAEAEDEIDDEEEDSEDDEESDEDEDEDEEEEDGKMQLSISTSTPIRLKQA